MKKGLIFRPLVVRKMDNNLSEASTLRAHVNKEISSRKAGLPMLELIEKGASPSVLSVLSRLSRGIPTSLGLLLFHTTKDLALPL